MSFTAEEICRFDEILAGMYREKMTEMILLEIVVLAMLVILFCMSRSKKMAYPRWSVAAAIAEEDQTRYRNGKKLNRRERDAQRNAQKNSIRQENKAWIAVIGGLLFCMGVALGITSAVRLERMQRDMEENAYVVYEGEFDCNYAESNRTMALTFVDGNGDTVSVKGDGYDPNFPERGTYTGRVVYAVHCGKVIEVESTPKEK